MGAQGYDVSTVAVDDGELTVGRWAGDPGTPTVLAAHGITANHLSWAAVATALAGRATLLAVDLRGRGRSGGLPGPYGMAAHAADLIAVLDDAGLERATLVGHSMGGFVVTSTAARHPDRVHALVLADGGVPLALPPAENTDVVLDIVLGPALARLSMTFESRAAYRAFWQEHPAFAGAWTDDLEAYVQYDVEGAEPELRSSVSLAAVRADGADMLVGAEAVGSVFATQCPVTLLWVSRGLLGERPGLYDDDRLAEIGLEPERVRTRRIPDLNHYTLVFDPAGAAEIAAEIVAAG